MGLRKPEASMALPAGAKYQREMEAIEKNTKSVIKENTTAKQQDNDI